ncbi:MAG: hypothetical protein GY821_12565 [Gammaproteobacteria bacterium]|nr:hypothetical protein [Gammaproteobacteria bacterium]
MKTQTLLDLKEKIEEGKVKKNKLEGQKEEALKNLKANFGCGSIKEAESLLKSTLVKIEKEEEILEEQIEKLEESCFNA